jgi:hypothetical protein
MRACVLAMCVCVCVYVCVRALFVCTRACASASQTVQDACLRAHYVCVCVCVRALFVCTRACASASQTVQDACLRARYVCVRSSVYTCSRAGCAYIPTASPSATWMPLTQMPRLPSAQNIHVLFLTECPRISGKDAPSLSQYKCCMFCMLFHALSASPSVMWMPPPSPPHNTRLSYIHTKLSSCTSLTIAAVDAPSLTRPK